MSENDGFEVDRLADLVEDVGEYVLEIKRAIVEDEGNGDLVELAEDLWEVLAEVEDVLETIDLEELPDAIDADDLPDAVDLEDVPEGLLDEDETAIDLGDVREAVNLRELWDTVDLTDLYKEYQELDDEVDDVEEDVTGDEDGLTGDDEDEGMVENVIGTDQGAHVESQLSQAVIEEKIEDAVEEFREALLSTHDLLSRLYEANQEKLGQPGRQPDSMNPTAYSTMPPGPTPDSASTRTTTVPAQVKYSRVETPRRIYGRRFDEGRRKDASESNGADAPGDGDGAADGEVSEADDGDVDETDGAADRSDETDREDEEVTDTHD